MHCFIGMQYRNKNCALHLMNHDFDFIFLQVRQTLKKKKAYIAVSLILIGGPLSFEQ